MFFLVALIAFLMTEVLIFHLGWITLAVPVMYILIMLYYLYYKNHLAARTDIAMYEKTIKKLEVTQWLLIFIIVILSFAITMNFISRIVLAA